MTTQLRLIEGGDRRPWRLDATTRAIGRIGVAAARIELAKARATVPDRPFDGQAAAERRAG